MQLQTDFHLRITFLVLKKYNWNCFSFSKFHLLSTKQRKLKMLSWDPTPERFTIVHSQHHMTFGRIQTPSNNADYY